MRKNDSLINCLRVFRAYRRRRMEITRHNFKARLPEIEEAIRSAAFVCIDGEFTGLHTNRGMSPFDLPDHRYQKLQESSRQFLLIQYGLCTFHYNKESDSYSNQAYNFYVWPRPCTRFAPDPRFLCQTSSLDFLASNQFDFNKLIKDGVSYLRPAELEKLRSQVLERQEYRKSLNTPDRLVVIPEDQEDFMKEVDNKLKTFLQSDQTNMELDRCNSFQRRLIYQSSKEKYPELSFTGTTRPGGQRVICISKDLDAKNKMVHDQEQAELSDVEDAFGFSRIIQTISESRKLVVGHNLVLDVCHTLNQFCSPLPPTYSDFKEMCSSILPNIVDTKLMANTIPLKEEIPNSSLSELHSTVTEAPFNLPTISQRGGSVGYKVGDEKYHEAGYDAFVTGLCFIAMHRRLAKICGRKAGGLDADTPEVKPFLNKLYLMKVNDIPYMNLGGEDVMPDRDHVFYLQIPKEWKTPDLVHLFSSFGFVNVFWLNDTSVFVSLKEKELSNAVLPALSNSTVYSISTYQKYLESLAAEREEPALALSKLSSSNQSCSQPRCPQSESGITPTLEKTFKGGVSGKAPAEKEVDRSAAGEMRADEARKRPVSPDTNPGIKRSKSLVEDKEKTFEEPPWD